MVSIITIENNLAEAYRQQVLAFEDLCRIRDNETSQQKNLRKRMHVEWHPRLPILEAKWYFQNCVYDGNELEGILDQVGKVAFNGIFFGPEFAIYSVSSSDQGYHFETCPECGLIYRMPPSPEVLEARRTFVSPGYAREQ